MDSDATIIDEQNRDIDKMLSLLEENQANEEQEKDHHPELGKQKLSTETQHDTEHYPKKLKMRVKMTLKYKVKTRQKHWKKLKHTREINKTFH